MAKASTKPTKGTRDFLPADLRLRAHVTDVIRSVFNAYGFEPLETPAIERLDTLMGKYGDEGDQLLFKVLRRGQPLVKGIVAAAEHIAQPGSLVSGRSGETAPGAEPLLSDLGLRYDLTVPLARVYAANQGALPSPFKRYQIQPVWRADTPGKGRFREFYQCDVDVVGSTSRVVEAEVLAAAATCLKTLGFADFELRLNHRGLLRAMIDVAGIAPELETEAIVAIDKLDKIGPEGVEAELERRGIGPDSRAKLLSLLGNDASLDSIAERMADHDAGCEAVADLREVLDLTSVTAASGHVKFDVTLARGLGYYTGCIFEIAVKDLAGSLGGGGRYDGLIGMFLGKDVPACGLSLGLERILVVMQERGMQPGVQLGADVALAPVNDEDLRSCLSMCQQLRDGGLRVDLRPRGIKPGKLRKYAQDRSIRAAAWMEPGANGQLSLWTAEGGTTNENLDASAVLDRLGATGATGGEGSGQ